MALAAVLAFALHALVPQGYMWAPVDGRVAVVACSDYAFDVLALAAHQHHHHAAHHAGGHGAAAQSCPYALAGGAALVASAPLLAVQQFALSQTRLPQLDQSAPRSIPLRFAAPRGPPTLS